MKKQDKKALFGKTQAELMKMFTDIQKQLAKNNIELRAGKLKNTRSLSTLRDDVARIKTVLGMKAFEKGDA